MDFSKLDLSAAFTSYPTISKSSVPLAPTWLPLFQRAFRLTNWLLITNFEHHIANPDPRTRRTIIQREREMCQNVRAIFLCSPWHASLGEEPTRIKHIAHCRVALSRGRSCPKALRTDDHVLQEDEPDNYCPECKRETPPETP